MAIKYVREVVYKLTFWSTAEVVDRFDDQVGSCRCHPEGRMADGAGRYQVEYEADEAEEMDRAVAWLEAENAREG